MKIAFLSGPLEYSVCLANALAKKNDVTFFYGVRNVRDRDEAFLKVLDPSIRQYPINDYRIRDIRNLSSYYQIARQLNSYDLVHIQNGDIWLSLWRFVFRKVPMVFTVHDPHQHFGLKKANREYQDFAQRWGIKQSSRFIVHGERLKTDLAERYSLPLDRIQVIEHGEFSIYKKIARPDSRPDGGRTFKRILFFGIVRPNKGLEHLIKAEPLMTSQYGNYKICVAGKFPGDRETYEAMMSNKEKFEIIDEFVPGNKVAGLFEFSDIVVLPYITATQSGVLPLAFGFGKPVVATSTGSLPEVIEDGKTGLLVPPSDEQALAKALLELLCNDSKCRELGENALEFAQTRLGWDRLAEQTEALYQTMGLKV